MNRFAKVRLELDSRPESVALVRAALSGLSEWRELDAELLNDLKTAISEACNNVVVHAYGGDAGPLAVHIDADGDGLATIVRDHGVGFQAVASHADGMGVGLAVMSALAARAEFATPDDGGTEVRMWFPTTSEAPRPLAHFTGPLHAGPVPPAHPNRDLLTPALEARGHVRVTVSPVSLTAHVLGRLARVLAATSRFSFDRFSDVYLVADAIGAHARRTATSDRISFTLRGTAKRLTLSVGPFAAGTSARLQRRLDAAPDAQSPLSWLADEITVQAEADGDGEMLHLVLRDRDERARAPHASQ